MALVRGSTFAAAAFSVAACGCSTPLAGTNDAALVYELVAGPSSGPSAPPPPGAAAAAAPLLKARTAAAQVAADVDAIDAARVRVVVDADVAGAVDALIRWRGGLGAYHTNDSIR